MWGPCLQLLTHLCARQHAKASHTRLQFHLALFKWLESACIQPSEGHYLFSCWHRTSDTALFDAPHFRCCADLFFPLFCRCIVSLCLTWDRTHHAWSWASLFSCQFLSGLPISSWLPLLGIWRLRQLVLIAVIFFCLRVCSWKPTSLSLCTLRWLCSQPLLLRCRMTAGFQSICSFYLCHLSNF